MSAATLKKLSRLGYDEKFIQSICIYGKDKSKRYELRITDDGIFICYACFDTKTEFSEIYDKLEGFHYELKDVTNDEYLGDGILDYSLFEQLDGKWEIKLTRKEVASILSDILYEHECNSAGIDFDSTYDDDIEKQIEWKERKQALEIAIKLFSKGR